MKFKVYKATFYEYESELKIELVATFSCGDSADNYANEIRNVEYGKESIWAFVSEEKIIINIKDEDKRSESDCL